MDDWCLSGANAAGNMEALYYENPRLKMAKDVTMLFMFHIITAECIGTISSLPMFHNVNLKFSSNVAVNDYVPKKPVHMDHKSFEELKHEF